MFSGRHGRKPTERPVLIYALREKGTHVVRYIGQTGTELELVILKKCDWDWSWFHQAQFVEQHRATLINTIHPEPRMVDV